MSRSRRLTVVASLLLSVFAGQLLARPTPVRPEGRWVRAADLKPGDHLIDDEGRPVTVTSVSFVQETAPTYNLEVEGTHTYFVAADQTGPAVWVHNDCCKIAGTRGLEHSFGRHAGEWNATHGGSLTRTEWQALIEDASRSTKVVPWSLEGAETIGYFSRVGGNKPFFVQFYLSGERAGELATAFIPNEDQIGAILAKLGKAR